MNKRLFKEIIIWREINDKTVVRYIIFEILPDNKFYVKKSDFFYDPLDYEDVKNSNFDLIDSLFQGGLDMEDEFCDSIEEAIEKHEKDFS